MVGYEVKPTKTILQTDPNMRERVDALWHEEAHRMGLIDRNGEFLLLFWFSGSPKREWRRMRDATSTRIPSRIATATGDPEFIAVSLDGRSLCAVSVEEYEDWIITHSFP
ncbi:hypothetical protein [Streptomyces lateritius]|uniref:hypothetical protein n=1 Tax=Streptomyces lateritius TaxID=67313 RepID=UPI001C8B1B67|nr:hypothetical protein [Streptomyces lateritius]MBX9424238.1 hypothetical protein [Streptomyces lateritius]